MRSCTSFSASIETIYILEFVDIYLHAAWQINKPELVLLEYVDHKVKPTYLAMVHNALGPRTHLRLKVES